MHTCVVVFHMEQADFAVLFVLCVYVCAFGGYVFASATLASVLEKNAASIVVISVVFASAISNLRFSPEPIVMDDRVLRHIDNAEKILLIFEQNVDLVITRCPT